VKSAAAQRWVDAVNAEGSYGQWRYTIAKKTSEVPETITKIASSLTVEAVRH
jgi:type III restriction enzyme